MGVKWLEATAELEGITIVKEFHYGKYYLDGYCTATKTAYEFFECFWHGKEKKLKIVWFTNFKRTTVLLGCPKHTSPDTIHPIANVPMRELHKQTEERVDKLKKLGLNVVTCWQHQFMERLSNDAEFRTHANDVVIREPLRPRDAFYGGQYTSSGTEMPVIHYTYCL